MPVATELLEILVCPETKQSVSAAAKGVLDELNARVESGELRNRGGDPVSTPISDGLVREDGQILYVVEDGIPVMLIEESIEIR